MTIAEIGERALIARLRARIPPEPDWVLTGIGDDAAVLRPERGTVDVVTTDALVEDVHFCRAWNTPHTIGHKALAVNLSDLAAMGASPRAVLLSLTLPPALPVSDFDAMLDGFLDLAVTARVPLVGGNLTRSPGPLILDVTAVGSAHPRRLLRRAGARQGDRLFVTGSLGAAAAGLAICQNGTSGDDLDDARRGCVTSYEMPHARVRTGLIVGRNRAASACIDVSDGLADAASQIAEASGCGVVLQSLAIPIHPGATAWAEGTGRPALPLAIAGGEDYELLFAVPKRRVRLFLAAVRQARETEVTEIGVCTNDTGAWLVGADGRTPLGAGFEHF